jgi:hypothetical protein
MRVNTRGRPLDLPQRCACCGQAPSSEMPAAVEKNADGVSRRQAAGWRFPVCAACAHHSAKWQSAPVLPRVIAFGGLGIVLLVTMAGGGASLFFIGGAVAFVVAALAGYWGKRQARALCHAGCAAPGPPVIYVSSFDNIDSFDFTQTGYAADFMRANLGKLAALPRETLSVIQPDLDRIAAAEAQRKAMERERVRLEAAAEAERKALERERVRAAEAERKALERERARIEAEVAHDNEAYERCIARMDAAKGPAGRKGALEAGLRSLRQEHMRDRLMLEASRIEVAAALAKAEGLKSPEAKLRTLSEALEAIRNDAVPDHLQLDLIRSLEAAIATIEDEKNSIDMV